ncbi:MAG: HNH endonuclease [Deltaproteobacteria bacterium RIFOXYA12_FULL_58_15]|nr:MAG: HNH endonuclease [Deltaproteobacteria bacterium RIFOXYA12_FULL_58_15]OGR10102.1 MAG: HNH endonuclease [Deltaproteobacteria bacterium RIFOXYB12_FULL_58_9]
MTENFFIPSDEEHVQRERAKARELRHSQWWKGQKGRGQCYYCKARVAPGDLTMDHIVPVIRGGKTTKSNVVTSCKSCNDAKNHMLPVEWVAYLESLRKRE